MLLSQRGNAGVPDDSWWWVAAEECRWSLSRWEIELGGGASWRPRGTALLGDRAAELSNTKNKTISVAVLNPDLFLV